MALHGGFGASAIALFDRRDDGAMLMHRFFRDFAAETGTENVNMDVQPGE
jgi:hypothetical protein